MNMSLKQVVLLIMMLISAYLGTALRPNIMLADERQPIDLNAMVPRSFGGWHEEVNMQGQVVNPQQEYMLNKLYSQTLSRTYVDGHGYRIMLSIAYGKDQSPSLQMHQPDFCYPAQGFTIISKQRVVLDLLGKPISATHMYANLEQRFEPITYWTLVGDYVFSGGINKRLYELRYRLRKRVPDGILVRVSSIEKDTAEAYTIQNKFAIAMLAAMSSETRQHFIGTP